MQCTHKPRIAGFTGGFRWKWKNIWKKIMKNGFVWTAWLYQEGIQRFISLGNRSDLFRPWISQNKEQTNWNQIKWHENYLQFFNKITVHLTNDLSEAWFMNVQSWLFVKNIAECFDVSTVNHPFFRNRIDESQSRDVLVRIPPWDL